MTVLLSTSVLGLVAIPVVVWRSRARARRRLNHVLNTYAQREIARAKTFSQHRGQS
jgi:hypothetical protein